MSVRRIWTPPIIAPERALRSEASSFRDQLQLAHKLAPMAPRFAPVSPEGGGRDPGSLYLGGSPMMHRPWSFAPVHHNVADAATQDPLAQVETQDRAEQAEAATTAASIAEELEAGKSLDLVAEERGLTRDEVIAELEAAGYEVETTGTARNGSDPRVTTIEDPQGGRTITETERYDGSYEITVAANGETATLPTRDERGWTVEEDDDPETGVTTTRYEDDLGDGTVEVVTELPNGVVIEETTPKDGATTTVVIVDGKETELAADQAITAEGCAGILDDVVGGKSLDEIAEELGLTRDQVIAQLEAAGYEVRTGTPTSGNGDVEATEIVDAKTGQVVAGHYSDHQHDAETIRYVDEEGNAVSRTEYGDGRVSETVTDQDGRQTTTVTEPVNGGETIEHEVEQDENLSAIAAQYGMTLEELEETNPELFDDDHKGGDLIRPGETVVIAGGTETTVTESANGYTLATGPDGSMTLTSADGTEIAIEPGSLDESLARTLLAVNADSSDPAEAKEGQIVTYVIEGLLAGQTYEDLVAELKMPAEEIAAALADGLAVPAETAEETDGQGNRIFNFQGEPPAGQAPSGGWVPVNVEGVWYWTDSKVAETIAAANATQGQLYELQASYEAGQAQIDVWALDPNYEEAMQAAEATLDEALAPHGYDWAQPEPEGSLEDASNRLSDANARLEQASGALEAYEESERLLGEAIARQETMPFYPEGPKPDETDGDYTYEVEVEKGEAAAAEIQSLFYQADEQRTLGDKLLTDYTVGWLESQFDAAKEDGYVDAPEGVEAVEITIGDQTIQVAPEVAEAYAETGLAALGDGGQPVGIQIDTDGDGTLEWQWVEADLAKSWLDLQDAKALQEALGTQLELAGAYADYYEARSDLAEQEVQAEDVRQQLLTEYNNDHPELFEEDRFHTRMDGDHLGLFEGQELCERDGQIWVLNHFEYGDTEEALTDALDDPTQSEAFRERRDTPLNRAWQDVLNGSDGSDGLIALKNQELETGETVNRVLEDQFGAAVEKLDELLGELQAEYDDLLAEHGSGTPVLPETTWQPENVSPIEIAGQTVFVTLEGAEAYAAGGFDALAESGLQVKIKIDTDRDGAREWRWVDPDLAESWIALSEAQKLREATEETRSLAEAAANWYAHQRTQTPKLYDDAETAAHNGRLETTYLEAHEERALDERFQPWFQALYDNGYNGTARSVSDDDIIAALNLDMGTEEGRTALDKVREQIRKVGGEDAKAEIVPIFFVDGKAGVQQSALFAVENDKGETRYIDAAGKDFDDLQDFQDNNDLFYTPGGTGRLIVPENLQMTPGADGKFALAVVQARNVSNFEEVVLPLASLGSNLLGTVLVFTPAAPVGAVLIAAGSAAGIGYTVYDQARHLRHGGEWGDERSVANIAGLAANLLAGAGSIARIAAMVRSLNMSMSRAFLATMGLTRPTGTIANTSRLNRISNWLGGGAMATGMVPTSMSAKDLVKHGEDMSLVEYIDTWFGVMTGVPGFGLVASGPSSHPVEQAAFLRQADLNYLGEGSVTVDGKAVDAKALEIAVSQDAFLVIADETNLAEPTAVEQLVDGIRNHKRYKSRPGLDIAIYICGAGTRTLNQAEPYASYSTSLARDVSSRLGSRVHAIDGKIEFDEKTIVPKNSAVVELPNLPLTDISGGRSHQAPDHEGQEAQRRFWLKKDGRGPRIAAPFSKAALAQGAQVNGQPIDPMTLGAPNEPTGDTGEPSSTLEEIAAENTLDGLVDPQFRSALAEHIRSQGEITFADFMKISLYGIDGEGGYYNSGNVAIGGEAADHFITAPELSPAFGHTIGNALAEMYQAMGCPERFDVVEMGAGNGTLARDVIDRLQAEDPAVYHALNYVIVERSQALITRQRARLEGEERICWVRASADALPLGNLQGVILSNELVDAFPVHRAVLLPDGCIQEIYVTVDGNGRLIEKRGKPSPELSVALLEPAMRFLLDSPNAQREQTLTINARAISWMKDGCAALDKGFVITIDYGQPGSIWEQPYCFYRGRRPVEWAYRNPGAIDITAKVDPVILLQLGEQVGLRPASSVGVPATGFEPQEDFLRRYGLGKEIMAVVGTERHNAMRLGPFSDGFFALTLEKEISTSDGSENEPTGPRPEDSLTLEELASLTPKEVDALSREELLSLPDDQLQALLPDARSGKGIAVLVADPQRNGKVVVAAFKKQLADVMRRLEGDDGVIGVEHICTPDTPSLEGNLDGPKLILHRKGETGAYRLLPRMGGGAPTPAESLARLSFILEELKNDNQQQFEALLDSPQEMTQAVKESDEIWEVEHEPGFYEKLEYWFTQCADDPLDRRERRLANLLRGGTHEIVGFDDNGPLRSIGSATAHQSVRTKMEEIKTWLFGDGARVRSPWFKLVGADHWPSLSASEGEDVDVYYRQDGTPDTIFVKLAPFDAEAPINGDALVRPVMDFYGHRDFRLRAGSLVPDTNKITGRLRLQSANFYEATLEWIVARYSGQTGDYYDGAWFIDRLTDSIIENYIGPLDDRLSDVFQASFGDLPVVDYALKGEIERRLVRAFAHGDLDVWELFKTAAVKFGGMRNLGNPEPFSNGSQGSQSAFYVGPSPPQQPQVRSNNPEIFRSQARQSPEEMQSPAELLEGYDMPFRRDLTPSGGQPGAIPRDPADEVDAGALQPEQGAGRDLGPVPRVDLTRRGLPHRDGPPRIKTYTAITAACVVVAAFPEHWRVRIAATACGIRGALFIAESMFPAAFAPDKRLGRALGVTYLLTWPPNIAEGFRNLGANLWVNLPNQTGNWLYAGKKLQEVITRKFAKNIDKWALPLYFGGNIPYTIQSVQAGSVFDIVAGSLFVSGSGYLWVKSVRPTENKFDERLVLAGTFGVGLLLTSGIVWKSLLQDEEEEEEVEPSEDSPTPPPAETPSPDVPVEPPVAPAEPEEPMPQLVVTTQDSLKLMAEPTGLSDSVAGLRPGSLVHETGERKTDEAGNEWVPVRGYGWDGVAHRGWVMASSVAPHPDGAQNESGRFNPELETQGHQWVVVEPDQSIGEIAREHSVDVADTVMLNMAHIVDPNVIFRGDRIYLPAAS